MMKISKIEPKFSELSNSPSVASNSSPNREQNPKNETFSPDRGSGEAEGVIKFPLLIGEGRVRLYCKPPKIPYTTTVLIHW